ncbi:small ribosomal subunit biogenesis GTPase RsgA [Candidatus Synechococcus calcipolaris G9]|uniref:Small ribosomal subunit biogenesis GTPase RsgA n=2 Tax=Synechococcus TaxID=1129 RepID=A0ABT6F104_9SYNE|nr:small ribosomal subunit biogenesis GTPase RsgA [Candidatus Synechococcus calcipolaris]MDG2991539.1 small ribosomal subunit biogenesis GTPase RsgA [Candidatus Synechococcus calcipolaris G9]
MAATESGLACPTWLGTVLAVQANFYRVRLASAMAPRPELLCVRRSRLKKMGQQVMVGDQVQVDGPDWQGGRGAIAQVLPRQSELLRPAVANADQILLVFALADPEPDTHQINRFLITAEETGFRLIIALSKADLVTPEQRNRWQSRLEDWGYRALILSVPQSLGWQDLRTLLADHLTVICGPSGVGKSSLIQYLMPDESLRIGTVSERWGRGKHTTRHVELFALTEGGLLADTPGFNQPNLPKSPQTLATCFPEIRQRLTLGTCHFQDCYHHHEPGCIVRGDWPRYPFYLDCLETIQGQPLASDPSLQSAEPNVKLKSGSGGKLTSEPLLDTKKYRRRSRREQHQRLMDWQEREEEIYD